MPGELKRLLSDEVRRSGRSLNDVAVGILASRFAVSFDESGRAGKEPGKSGSVLLRMPAELKDKLAARAAQRKRNVNDLIVETLTERLGGKEPMASTNGKARARTRKSASRSSASATARARSCRASSTTRTRTRTTSSPA